MHVLQQRLYSKLIVSSVIRKRDYYVASIIAMSPLACPIGQDMHMALLSEEVAIRIGLRGEVLVLVWSRRIVFAHFERILKCRGKRRVSLGEGMI